MPISPLDPNFPIVKKNGTMQDRTNLFMLQVANFTRPYIGSGSPEGVVSGQQGQTYMDSTGTAGNILYIKKTDDIGGDTKQGWILI